MKANDLVAPYLPKRCGEEGDYDSADFIFQLQHTSLNEFLDLVGSKSRIEGRRKGGKEERRGGKRGREGKGGQEAFLAFEFGYF